MLVCAGVFVSTDVCVLMIAVLMSVIFCSPCHLQKNGETLHCMSSPGQVNSELATNFYFTRFCIICVHGRLIG